MPYSTRSISLPEEFWELLDNEAQGQSRDRSKQVQQILRERYRRAPRMEEKLTVGDLKK